MSDIDLSPFGTDRLAQAGALVQRAFGEPPLGPVMAAEGALFEPERSLAAERDGELAGVTWIQSLRMALPGGVRPVAGVTAVAVSPVHRRRGVLTAMMTRQLADVRERGEEALAALWASEPAIYQRFGYGLAVPMAGVRGQRAHVRFTVPERGDVRLRLVEPPEAEWAHEQLDAVYTAAARPGWILRDLPRWRRAVLDPPEAREGAGPLAAVVADGPDGTPEGYVLYRMHAKRDDTGPAGVTRVGELVAASARARGALWRHVATLDLTATFEWFGLAPDDPLFHLVVDPRRLSFTVADGLWVRLVDLPRALTERCYRAPAAAVVDVVDDVCPWNAGRWRVDLSPDGASCERTTASADLTVGTTELATVHLGGPTLRALALAGRVDEHTDGAVGALSDAFAGAVAPQCVESF